LCCLPGVGGFAHRHMKLEALRAANGAKGRFLGKDLLPGIYNDLQRIAASRLVNEHRYNLLQQTDLIDEAWLRVCGSEKTAWDSERHLFASICRAMRRILVEQARRRQRRPVLDDSEQALTESMVVAAPLPDEELLAVDEALTVLWKEDPSSAELVDMRFFGGLTQSQAAAKMGISRSSADRLWVFARAWLASRIREPGGDEPRRKNS
jgi:RNA polymerase sigma factor (TIGR02999 family)